MFDYRVLIILTVALLTMYIVQYDCEVILTPRVLYWLLPIALAMVLLIGCTNIIFPQKVRISITVVTIVLICWSIYVFFISGTTIYKHRVFSASIKVVWVAIITATILYWKDPQRPAKMGALRIILLLGIFASIYLIPEDISNLLSDQVSSLLRTKLPIT